MYLLIVGMIGICLPDISFGETIIVYSAKNSELCRFEVDIAATPEEQARGLMFRKAMGDHEGMFFIFARDETRHFWMRNTLIPLDMIFINSKFSVVDIHRNAQPLDETLITSRKPARYVLELNAGKAETCGIKNGSKIKLIQALR
jgi:hypothetical protein